MSYPRISSLQSPEQFQVRLNELGLDLPFAKQAPRGVETCLARPLQTRAGRIRNRFCILPMEGWDGTQDGRPSELTHRRWRRFGISGAALIWGGEAVAVRHDGRANPRQLVSHDNTTGDIAALRETLVVAHQEKFESSEDLCIGLQLTHSGRFARPYQHKTPEPRAVYRHPLLDARCQIVSDAPLLSDDDLKQLIEDFVVAARRAQQAGFTWIDIKHCHGYLGHELLSGYDRPGLFGGSFENRTRFIRSVVDGIRTEIPDMEIGVRVSVFDFAPFVPDKEGVGVPETTKDYRCAFGGDSGGQGIDLSEPVEFLRLLSQLGIELICTSCGSPYYNPHIQRPALFPPSDGYLPPEDPLVGVHRQISVTARLKQLFPELTIVGSGYSYLQEWLPAVAEQVVGNRMADSIGLGRMVLSYPELPADVFAGTFPDRKRVCRTFSDCTTGPRNGLVSGCYPLHEFYRQHSDREILREVKKQHNLSRTRADSE